MENKDIQFKYGLSKYYIPIYYGRSLIFIYCIRVYVLMCGSMFEKRTYSHKSIG
jgi:hypothetical protein